MNDFQKVAGDLNQAIGEITQAHARVDASVSEILTLHFFVERQLDAVLATRFIRPKQLARFGFGHKVSLLQALWNHSRIDQAGAALTALNDIRNAAAHNDTRALATGRIRLAHQLAKVVGEGELHVGSSLETMAVVLLCLLHLAVHEAAEGSMRGGGPILRRGSAN